MKQAKMETDQSAWNDQEELRPLREAFTAHLADLAAAPARLKELREFIRECQSAGPDRIEDLKVQAQKLLIKAGFNYVPDRICEACGYPDSTSRCRCVELQIRNEATATRFELAARKAEIARLSLQVDSLLRQNDDQTATLASARSCLGQMATCLEAFAFETKNHHLDHATVTDLMAIARRIQQT